MIDWSVEWPQIRTAAGNFGVNPFFIAAIREAENGGPGKEFGVLSVPAPTYADQLRECCISVAHRMALFNGQAHDRFGLISIMSSAFIWWFAQLWAPRDVQNDPQGLNNNWYLNAYNAQSEFARNGGPL